MRNDYAKLNHWQRLMRGGQVMVIAVRKRMADEVLELIDEGFENQKDPYGNPWAPKKKPDGRRILHGRTLKLRTRWHTVPVAYNKFIAQPGVDYAAPHQAPRFNRRPRRAMVPFARRKLPVKWRARLMRAAIFGFVAIIRERLRGL